MSNGNILQTTPPHIIGMIITGPITITLTILMLIVIFLIRTNLTIKKQLSQKSQEALQIFHHIL